MCKRWGEMVHGTPVLQMQDGIRAYLGLLKRLTATRCLELQHATCHKRHVIDGGQW